MKKMLSINLFCLLQLVISVSAALAKGPADKITIFGPGLSEPIEITDAQILERIDLAEYHSSRFSPQLASGPANNSYTEKFYI